MAGIFDNKVFCKNCNTEMKNANIVRNGFEMRALVCKNCDNKIIHPADKKDYEEYLDLKDKKFQVKLRLVGNSYTVSIPKEIVRFIREQEKVFNEMVNLCFEDAKRLSLNFGDFE